MKTMKKAQGFSLIEVLAAVSVSAILAISVIPKFLSFKDGAQISKLQEIHASITSTAETYKALAGAGILNEPVSDVYTANGQKYKFHASGYPDIAATKENSTFYLDDLIDISGDVTHSKADQKWSITLGKKCIAYKLSSTKLQLMNKNDTDGSATTEKITDGIRVLVGPNALIAGTCRQQP